MKEGDVKLDNDNTMVISDGIKWNTISHIPNNVGLTLDHELHVGKELQNKANKYPMIQEALDSLEVVIKLHQKVDND